ncbi:hypothetical protein POV27_16215 [Aureisphaera galaxeae]|uniref:hypothetical protein n=1 Tax=Aureisphaera galaxeae TaxID=1538023 RepID=UPI0023505AF5|nr:hypothetical protein [Aureisphaera galaxeae]MDC8005605.1 hypothetical protein [Aureisphaera galaxeae]
MISVAFGNSVFLGTLFTRPVKGTLRRNRRLAILNDQLFFGANFIYVFFKVYILFGIFASMCFDLRYLIDHNYMFVLIAVVMFLESWKHITRTFRKSAFKVLLINALVLGAVSLVLSQTSIFNYKKMDAALLAGNPKIDVPISSFESTNEEWGWDHLKVYMDDGTVKYNLNKEPIQFEDIYIKVVERRSRFRWGMPGRSHVCLLASHDLPISEIKKIEKQLFLAEARKIMYVTRRPEGQFTSRYDLDGLAYSISPDDLDDSDYLEGGIPLPPPVPDVLMKELFADKEEIVINLDDAITIQEKKYVDRNELLRFFKDHINNKTYFNLKFEPSTSYQNYISVLGIYKQALSELRDEVTTIDWENARYGDTRYKYEEEQREAKEMYPYSLLHNFDTSRIPAD